MSIQLATFEYTFGDLVFIGRRRETRYKTTWYLKCPECQQEHMFRQSGTKLWHTSCEKYHVEWTVTPREYHISRSEDMTLIMGEE